MAKANLTDQEIEDCIIFHQIPSDNESLDGIADENEEEAELNVTNDVQFNLFDDLPEEDVSLVETAYFPQAMGIVEDSVIGDEIIINVPPSSEIVDKPVENLPPACNSGPEEEDSVPPHIRCYRKYETSKVGKKSRKKQKGKRYTPTTTEEMDVFLGINILMGIKKLPS
ncbi:hypothetical protein J6590_028060 [Homalodisca vitripennis]|nr:hypothetical protein J6590_028060 [Homalodisca vitripennis]